jgi:hypothetical protein
MASQVLPWNPVENWEQVRDEWIGAVERFMAAVEAWAAKHEWGTRRDPKRIEESRLGPYVLSRLLVHAVFGRFVLDPVCRYVAGGEGLIDFYAIPSYDSLTIVRDAGGSWFLHLDEGAHVERLPWTEEVFIETVGRLREMA